MHNTAMNEKYHFIFGHRQQNKSERIRLHKGTILLFVLMVGYA